MGRDFIQIRCDTKSSWNLNETLSFRVISALGHLGVKNYCLCPGGRNSALIELLSEEEGFQKYFFHDERSAGFFALGKIMATQAPCAVVVTSGTAVGELFPAVMEAYYSRLPLIVVSADRPKRFRGTGAPQTAEQERLFGIYAPHFEDVEENSTLNMHTWDRRVPCHINVCLEEAYAFDYSSFPDIPVADFAREEEKNPSATEGILQFLEEINCPLILVGALSSEEKISVKKLLLKLQVPCVLEGISQLRNDRDLKPFSIISPKKTFEKARESGYLIDGILRIGGVPTTRLWRDTEYLRKCKLLSVSSRPFSGSSFGSLIYSGLSFLSEVAEKCSSKMHDAALTWLEKDHKEEALLEDLYLRFPLSQQALVHKISKKIPLDSRIFLGNSLPIRDWDMFSVREHQTFHDVHAVRGLNGIDGQISTFFGLMHKEKHNIAIIGDLTALYDMNAPFVLKDCQGTFTLIIINNGGGKIFQKLFKNPLIQNRHTLGFKYWPQIFGLSYLFLNFPDFDESIFSFQVIEVVPKEEETLSFEEEFLK